MLVNCELLVGIGVYLDAALLLEHTTIVFAGIKCLTAEITFHCFLS